MPENPPPAHWYSLQASDQDWQDLEVAVQNQCGCSVDAPNSCGSHQLLAGRDASEPPAKVHGHLLFARRMAERWSNEEFVRVGADGSAVQEVADVDE